MQVNILEAKNRLSELVKAAQHGKEVVIANRGVPAVRLVRAEHSRADEPEGTGTSLLAWLRANPVPPHLRRSQEEIEQATREERAAWD